MKTWKSFERLSVSSHLSIVTPHNISNFSFEISVAKHTSQKSCDFSFFEINKFFFFRACIKHYFKKIYCNFIIGFLTIFRMICKNWMFFPLDLNHFYNTQRACYLIHYSSHFKKRFTYSIMYKSLVYNILLFYMFLKKTLYTKWSKIEKINDVAYVRKTFIGVVLQVS